MGAVKNKVHELVDGLTDDQAERVLEVLEDPTFFADDVPPGVLSEDDPGFWQEIERRAERARSGTEPGTPWDEVFTRLRARDAGTDRSRAALVHGRGSGTAVPSCVGRSLSLPVDLRARRR